MHKRSAVSSLPETSKTRFVEFLRGKSTARRPLHSALGLCADLNVKITAEDISQARDEMWGNFPRDIEL